MAEQHENLSEQPLRVLVVEDDPASAEGLAELLNCLNFDCRIARNGEEALRKAYEFLPDVVLLDLGLPVRDGYEVAHDLRQIPDSSTALIIAITGHNQPEDEERSQQVGIDLHMAKPVDISLLMGVLLEYRRELQG